MDKDTGTIAALMLRFKDYRLPRARRMRDRGRSIRASVISRVATKELPLELAERLRAAPDPMGQAQRTSQTRRGYFVVTVLASAATDAIMALRSRRLSVRSLQEREEVLAVGTSAPA